MVRQGAAGQPDRVGGHAQVAADQGEVAGLDGDVGAGAHGEAEVGLGERGGVVDAVADHRHHAALGLQPLRRRRPCRPAAPRRSPSSMPTSAATARATRCVVAGEQHRAQAERAQLARPPRREVGLTVSATDEHAAGRAVPADGDRGAARRPRRVGRGRVEVGGQRAATTRRAARGRPTTTACPSTTPCDAEALEVGEVRRPRAGRRPARRRRGDRPGDRVLGGVPRARRPAAAPRRRPRPSAGDDVDQRHPAGGDGAGLVEHDGVDPAGGLQHLGALDQDAELGAAAGADQQRGRRGQARARTGRR